MHLKSILMLMLMHFNENHNYCYVKMPDKYNNILKYNSVGSEPDCYRGEDCVEKFCKT